MRLSSRASFPLPCRSHARACRAAGLCGSIQNGEPAAGLACARVSPAGATGPSPDGDEQPVTGPSAANAASAAKVRVRTRVRVGRNILPPRVKVTVSDGFPAIVT